MRKTAFALIAALAVLAAASCRPPAGDSAELARLESQRDALTAKIEALKAKPSANAGPAQARPEVVAPVRIASVEPAEFRHYITVQGIGREATERIYYLTMTKYLSRLSDFEDARRQTLKATRDLFPDDKDKLTTVRKAFASVGIGDADQ